MKTIALTISALSMAIISTSSQAALAPNYQRAAELTAVIDAVAAELPKHPITKVIYQKPDQYQIVAGPCAIRATITSKTPESGMVGPRQFDVNLSRPRCGK